MTSIGTWAFSGCKKLTIYGYADSTAESYASSNSIPFEYLHKIKASCENGVYTVSAVYGGKDAPTGKIMAAIYEGGVLQEVKILDAKETQTFEFQKKVSEGNVKFIWLSDSETMQPECKMLEMDV